jgi:hypothetical protein
MTRFALTRAWGALVGLSLLAAAFSAGLPTRVAAPVIVLLALFKARLILSDYLDLRSAPAWRRGFTMVLVLFCGLVLGLYFTG